MMPAFASRMWSAAGMCPIQTKTNGLPRLRSSAGAPRSWLSTDKAADRGSVRWHRSLAFPSFGNAQRDSIIGPKWFDSDLSMVKIVPMGEEVKIQFRAETFNVFNHPNLGNPDSCVDCSNAGTITGLANNAIMRRMQFGLRFDF